MAQAFDCRGGVVMIPVTPDHLESIAFSTGATIELRPNRAFLTHAGVTYGTTLLATLDADPRVRLDARGSWLDAEGGES